MLDMTRVDLLGYIESTYDTKAEYLWAKYPDYAVFRHKKNRKWFAILMHVTYKQVGLSGDGSMDILDVKLDSEKVDFLKQQEGYLPAYHMNKRNWLSICLDQVLEADVKELLGESYLLTRK